MGQLGIRTNEEYGKKQRIFEVKSRSLLAGGADGALARLLAEVQRIKSEGDYAAARDLFETYGVHFDPDLRDEVVARVDHLKLPSYTGFVMPKLEPVTDGAGTITDVKISYPCDLATQMLEYSRSGK